MPQHDTPPAPVEPLVTNNSTTRQLLLVLHYASPIALLLFFLAAFTFRTIAASESFNTNANHAGDADSNAPTGPGGKPLPKRTPPRSPPKKDPHDADLPRARKLIFEWLSVLAALTFVANAINIIVHALYSRGEQWWCGQSVVVRSDGTPEPAGTRMPG